MRHLHILTKHSSSIEWTCSILGVNFMHTNLVNTGAFFSLFRHTRTVLVKTVHIVIIVLLENPHLDRVRV